MSCIIRCYTLFDITRTGVQNRRVPSTYNEEQAAQWEKDRNKQINFDTLIQVISLRSLPENITSVLKKKCDFKEFQNFGFLFEDEEPQEMYHFDFTVNHITVFNDGITDLGSLYSDCENVPMIKIGTEWSKLPSTLDTSPEMRNIYFEVISNE